ncbi:MAG: ribosome small subunit-dependent GTPase A [Bacteroidota bacterium]
MQGTVIKSTGSWYQVRSETGELIKSRVKGRFRLDGLPLTNPVAVGDVVEFSVNAEDNTGNIRKILPRENYVVRQSPRKRHFLHLIASNIDQAVVIATIVEPMLKQGFIDRFLLMTEPYNIPTTIIFNKSDLYDEAAMNMFHYLKDLYEGIGYQVLLVSAENGEGTTAFKQLLQNKTTLLSGQSGVGKSSLVNTIEPSLDLKTGEISDYSGKGMHTTTFAEMFTLSFGGFIIDTPGIKTLSFNNLSVEDVTHNFREIFAYSKDCKYNDCTHRNEPHCAVKAAIERGEISELRYINYVTLLNEIEEQNSWERKEM